MPRLLFMIWCLYLSALDDLSIDRLRRPLHSEVAVPGAFERDRRELGLRTHVSRKVGNQSDQIARITRKGRPPVRLVQCEQIGECSFVIRDMTLLAGKSQQLAVVVLGRGSA